MRYIKLFEVFIADNADYSELIKSHKFKVGDYVRVPINSLRKEIFRIVAIDTRPARADNNHQLYHIQDLRPAYKNAIYSNKGDEFELVPDYEMDAIKYNL